MTKNNRGIITLIVAVVSMCMCVTATGIGGAAFFLLRGSNGTLPFLGTPLAQGTGESPVRVPLPDLSAAPSTTPRPINSTPFATSVAAAVATPAAVATRSINAPASTRAPTGPVQPVASPDTIFNTELPQTDLADIAVRFKGISREQTKINCSTLSKGYNIGDKRTFTLSNQDTNTLFKATAELRYKTASVYAWVQQTPEKVDINEKQLKEAMDQFTSKVLPATQAFFGQEANPGVDCDPHIHIIHAAGVGRSVGGYFSSPDGFPKSVREDSNEGEVFIIHAAPGYNGATPNSTNYMSTLAHELQHMISHNNTHAPSLWLEEGAAQLSERVNGFAIDAISSAYAFANKPDTQLNTWSESSAGENSAHYGAAYLFWAYIYDRFGPEVAKKAATHPERSVAGIMKALADAKVTNPDTGKAFTFEDLFADYVVANLNGKNKTGTNLGAASRYFYGDTPVPPMAQRSGPIGLGPPSLEKKDQVNQFGTHYYPIRGFDKPMKVQFNGSTTVPLLPMVENDGPFWWSHRADESNPKLTREFDLSRVNAATLKFRTWFRAEKDYDYAYVSASVDGGATWKTVKTTRCVTTDPNRANLGCGYTGSSGGGTDPRWIDEMADLSPFAGKKLQLRFEIVSDAGVNREGFAIDNIEIPEIGFRDDVNSNMGWKTEGFVRTDNLLPQTWKVQLIIENKDGTREVRRIALNQSMSGTAELDFVGKIKTATLAVSPTTLVTTEPASYEVVIK